MAARVEWHAHIWPTPRRASSEAIAALEARLDVRFPEDYLAVIREHQGMTPTPNSFPFGDGFETALNVLLQVEPDSPGGSLLAAQEALSMSDAPDGLVVAVDPGGSAICFDFRGEADVPTIVILDHEVNPASPLPVADTFTAFLQLLR